MRGAVRIQKSQDEGNEKTSHLHCVFVSISISIFTPSSNPLHLSRHVLIELLPFSQLLRGDRLQARRHGHLADQP